MRVLYRAEYLMLEKEFKQLINQYLNKAYYYGDRFRLKFNSHSFTFKPGVRANITYIIPPNPIPHAFVSVVKKYLHRKRVNEVYLKSKDRIIVFELGKDFKLILEMFGKGNIIVLENDIIIYALHYSNKIKLNQKYDFSNLKDFSTIFEQSKEKTIGYYFGVVLGKPYSDYLLDQLKIDKNLLLKNFSYNTIETIFKYYFDNAKPYYNESDFLFLPFDDAKIGKTFSYVVDLFYDTHLENEELIRLNKSKEQLIKQIQEYEEEVKKYKSIGNYILNNYNLIEEMINKAKRKEIPVNEKDKSFEIEV